MTDSSVEMLFPVQELSMEIESESSQAPDSLTDLLDIEQRYKVLLSIAKLTKVGAKGPERENLNQYDAQHLCIAVLHTIIHHVSPDAPTNRKYLLRAVTPLLELMDQQHGVTPNDVNHEEILNYVLTQLTNEHEQNEPFVIEYAKFEDGCLQNFTQEIRVLDEVFQARTNEPVFDVTVPFKIIYLKLLSQPIEDEQVAKEAVLEAQIKSGRLADAQGQARDARVTSENYRAIVRRAIEETRRSVDRVDWTDDQPTMLAKAEVHVEDRLSYESHLLRLLEEKLRAPGSEYRPEVNAIESEIRRCMETHLALIQDCQQARKVFIEEHDRQRFEPPAPDPKPNLMTDVLEPLLRLPIGESRFSLDRVGAILASFQLPAVPTLTTDVPYMLRPVQERTEHNAWLPQEEQVDASLPISELPWHRRPEIDNLLSVTEETPLEQILLKAKAQGFDHEELELLARIAMEALDDDREKYYVNDVRLGGPAFTVERVSFDSGGVAILPRRSNSSVE
jgi:hypothetical protein